MPLKTILLLVLAVGSLAALLTIHAATRVPEIIIPATLDGPVVDVMVHSPPSQFEIMAEDLRSKALHSLETTARR